MPLAFRCHCMNLILIWVQYIDWIVIAIRLSTIIYDYLWSMIMCGVPHCMKKTVLLGWESLCGLQVGRLCLSLLRSDHLPNINEVLCGGMAQLFYIDYKAGPCKDLNGHEDMNEVSASGVALTLRISSICEQGWTPWALSHTAWTLNHGEIGHWKQAK